MKELQKRLDSIVKLGHIKLLLQIQQTQLEYMMAESLEMVQRLHELENIIIPENKEASNGTV